MARKFSFDDLVGQSFFYYGAANGFFRLDDHLFEVIVGRDHELSSHMTEIRRDLPSRNRPGLLFTKPVARVKACREGTISSVHNDKHAYAFNGYSLVDVQDHVWLCVGTRTEGRYPRFVLRQQLTPTVMSLVAIENPVARRAALDAYGDAILGLG